MATKTEVIDTDPDRKEEITEALKVIQRAMKQMKWLQEYNFSGLLTADSGMPGPSGHIPAKFRLMDLGHEIVKAGADILRYAADLSDEEGEV